MSDAQIILLNGPTCSGKTTIARLIQDKSPTARAHMQIDTFVAMLPDRYIAGPTPDDRQTVFTQMRHGFHAAIAAAAAQGTPVIVDTVRGEPGWLDEWLDAFKPFTVLFVGVSTDLEDLLRREQAERTSPNDYPPTAERHYHTAHHKKATGKDFELAPSWGRRGFLGFPLW